MNLYKYNEKKLNNRCNAFRIRNKKNVVLTICLFVWLILCMEL